MQYFSKQLTSFDTHNAVKKLIAKGLKEPQAEIIVNTIMESRTSEFNQLATKEQLIELRSEMKTGIGKLSTEVKTDIEKLRTEIEKAKLSSILIIGGLIAASTTVIGALIKYFSTH